MIQRSHLGIGAAAFCVAGFMLALPSARAADAQPTEEQSLVHVYNLLTLASHDYEGHRKSAMRAVQTACSEMHLVPEGDHKNDPGQHDSDELMHQADHELQDILRVAQRRNQPRIADDVSDAIHEVHVALHIK